MRRFEINCGASGFMVKETPELAKPVAPIQQPAMPGQMPPQGYAASPPMPMGYGIELDFYFFSTIGEALQHISDILKAEAQTELALNK